ncbi:peptidylprolyl isomerase [Rubrivirga sp.]|uniref:peptidylprolyl isomerase n=1 Tax=Rubrivirga sp. TaxID=1885344 RepID=UPI003B528ACB
MRLLLSALLALTAVGAAAQPVAPGARLDGIAAVVGEQVVLYSEVDALVTQSTPQGQAPPPDLWSRALDRLVDQRVVIARARQDTTLTITDDIVSQRVDAQVAQLSAQVGGDAALEQAYGRSVEEVKVSIRDDVRDELLLQQYQGRRLREVTITPDEVREWFERIPVADRPVVPELVRVAHIVRVPTSDESGRTAVRAVAEALRDSVVAGQATIEELADRHSDDPGNTNRDGTQNGGLYTTLRLTDLEPRFQAAAAASEIGAISPVFETPFGYHVLRVNERDGNRISFNHILLQVEVGEAEAAAAREFLSVLRDSVQAGTPFEALARRHSQDPASAPRGGYVSVPQTRQRDLSIEGLGPEWRATLDSLDVGDVSEPAPVTLADAQGTKAYHIVLLQKRTPAHPLSIADDYSLLSQYALQEKQTEVIADWIDDLRRTVYVDIRAERYQPPVGG